MMKHTLVLIGWLGTKRAYLDIPREEAIRRYKESDGDIDEEHIEEFTFTDEFGTYAAWA